MVLQLGGCGRVGDCRNNFCGEGPVRVGRGPFLYSWVLFIHGRGCCLPPFRCGRGGIRLMPVTIVLAVLPTTPAARPRSIAHTPYVAHSHEYRLWCVGSQSCVGAMKPTRTVSRRVAVMGASVRRWGLMLSIKAEELAERAGISRSALQKIERGDPGVSIGAVMYVMQALG